MSDGKQYEWEQDDRESDKAYAAFLRYRDLPRGDRSVAKAIEGTKVRRRTWENWMSKFRWIDRVKSYERFLERSATNSKVDAIRAMNDTHVRSARAMQRVGLEALKLLERDIKRGKTPPASVIVKLLAQGQTLERLAAGEPTQILEETTRTFHSFMVSLRAQRGAPDRVSPFIEVDVIDPEPDRNGGSGNGTGA